MSKANRSSRSILFAFLVLIAIGCVPHVAWGADGPLPPANLRCEYLSNPLGIDVKQPRFFWVLDHTERGQKQSAYQLLVATRSDLLAQDKGDQWDTGKVASEQSTQVVYAGKPLESGLTCEQITGMVNAWQIGDPDLLLQIARKYNELVPGALEFEEKFIWERHEAMAAKILYCASKTFRDIFKHNYEKNLMTSYNASS